MGDTAIEELPDEELMLRCRDSGDDRFFTVLYERHRERAINFAFRLLGNHEDACEVFQECFLYLYRKVESYEVSAKFTTFLYRVLRNLALNRREKNRHRRHQDIDLADPAATDKTPDLLASWSEEQRRALRLLEDLPDAHREVLVLRILEDRAYEEIADIVDIPLGTVKSRIHHALEKLRASYHACERESDPDADAAPSRQAGACAD